MPPPPEPPNHAKSPASVAATLDLEPLRPLLEQLADLVAERLALRLNAQPATSASDSPTRRLITLDQLIERLPTGKTPKTWRGWLYQHTSRGYVPGCHKLGGRLFFDPEQTIPWILTGATTAPTPAGLDLPAPTSLHAASMAREPGQRRQRGHNA